MPELHFRRKTLSSISNRWNILATQDFSTPNSTGQNTTLPDGNSVLEELDLEQTLLDSILAFSILVMICSIVALLACRQPSPALLMHFRTLRVCDLFTAIFGASKMALVHHAREFQINFFLPDSLFFSSAFASCLTLIALHATVCLQRVRPKRFSKIDEKTAVTLTVIIWNTALTLGFLPLLGSKDTSTVRFWGYYSGLYLVGAGSLQLAALLSGLALALITARLPRQAATRAERDGCDNVNPLQGSLDLASLQSTHPAARVSRDRASAEQGESFPDREIILTSYTSPADSSIIDTTSNNNNNNNNNNSSSGNGNINSNNNDNITQSTPHTSTNDWARTPESTSKAALFHYRWASIESGLSVIFCLPFLTYLALTCPNCPFGHWSSRDTAVLYLIPCSLARALLGSCLHLYMGRELRRGAERARLVPANITASYTNPAFSGDHHDCSQQVS
ncbi:rhodopsin-like [Plakobranchus ocellatus]|uniref:Rhodopsin-like n=1 Tax=Plakobranchus ocellatus TaxID=259542 RepID=A0AAV3Z0A0_9GAST|nr:rhodopsin-like [Plakobranchus ocellatus]